MFNTTMDIALFIVALIAIITGISKGFIFFRKRWIASRNKRDKFFTGSWSNEGNIIKNRPTHYIDLTLSCAGKRLSGSFNMRKSDDQEGWVKLNLEGKRHSYSGKCMITQLKDGETINLGKIILKKDQERNLNWILVKGATDFFPKNVVLCRSIPVIG